MIVKVFLISLMPALCKEMSAALGMGEIHIIKAYKKFGTDASLIAVSMSVATE